MNRREFVKLGVTAAAATSGIGFPVMLRAQDVIKVGHVTPRTGFLGQLGAYGVMGAQMAVDEANTRGGVLGRKVELISEDTPNPGVAVTKAQKLIERDMVHFLVGEINSASGLAISEVAQRSQILYINTGWNSDEGRGARCQRYLFHVEGSNTMYTKTIGRWQERQGKLKGARWYFLTADYAFGHDLYRVSSRFLADHGGVTLGNDMIPTGTLDYSSYILKLRTIKPDLVYLNLAGADQTTFLKQYREFGAPFPLAGGVMDTVPFWAAGIDALTGYWQSLWYHALKEPGSPEFTAGFMKRYGKPPDNQAWGDYIGIQIALQAIAETKSLKSQDLVAHFEKGAKFNVLKGREAWFRDWDHQLLQTMYVVKVKDKAKARDQWDIFEIVEAQPPKGESYELIQPTKTENPCTLPPL